MRLVVKPRDSFGQTFLAWSWFREGDLWTEIAYFLGRTWRTEPPRPQFSYKRGDQEQCRPLLTHLARSENILPYSDMFLDVGALFRLL